MSTERTKLNITPATYRQIQKNISPLEKILKKLESNTSGILDKPKLISLEEYVRKTTNTNLYLIYYGKTIIGYASIWDGWIPTATESVGAKIEAAFFDTKYIEYKLDLILQLGELERKVDSSW